MADILGGKTALGVGIALCVILLFVIYYLFKKFDWRMKKKSKTGLIASPEDVSTNRKYVEHLLAKRDLVLYGAPEECEAFYKKYYKTVKIRKVYIDINEKKKIKIDNKLVCMEPFAPKELRKNDYVIVCAKMRHREDLDARYRKMKEKLKGTNRIFLEDFLRVDVAQMILDKKKMWLWFGYCQVDNLRKVIFSTLPSVKKDYVCIGFRYEKNTLKSNHKFEECLELLKFCDVITYVPLLVTQDKIEFEFDDYLPKNVKRIRMPRFPFKAYYPYDSFDGELFHERTVDGKKHWPYPYAQKVIDNLVSAGMTNEEIYAELMREDLIPEKVILKKLRYSYKYIEISENNSDIIISDYLKENLTKRMMYRDGIHYKNFIYFELGRRIACFMGIDCVAEINALEKKYEETGNEIQAYTDTPVLPCVVKTLGLDFIDDNTLWQVRVTEGGAWHGKVLPMKLMTRKEWIYGYADYIRASNVLIEQWS